MVKRSLMTILFFLMATGVHDAAAALYCAVDFSGRRCHFNDLESCQRSVGDNGSCVLNREGMNAPVGGAPYCLLESWKTDCIYQDMGSCRKAALPRKAICIENPNLAGAGAPPQAGGRANDPWPGGGEETDPKGRRYLPSPGYYPSPGSR